MEEKKEIRKIAVYGKAGIGKSTVSSNISAALSHMGENVMQVGCDPKRDSIATLCGSLMPTVLELTSRTPNVTEAMIEEVVFTGYNGLYGNMPIISHGLGLYTLYGHCSNVHVNMNSAVSAGAHIANTGKSGYAMGDHLHFGVLVQGIEVRPAEWMDNSWMQLNINDVIKSAKSIIDRN